MLPDRKSSQRKENLKKQILDLQYFKLSIYSRMYNGYTRNIKDPFILTPRPLTFTELVPVVCRPLTRPEPEDQKTEVVSCQAVVQSNFLRRSLL